MTSAFDRKLSKDRDLLKIALLGEFKLQFGELSITHLDTPGQSLLFYLLLHRHKVHNRKQLAFHFWPESKEAQALTNLRKAIYLLRQQLPNAELFLSAVN